MIKDSGECSEERARRSEYNGGSTTVETIGSVLPIGAEFYGDLNLHGHGLTVKECWRIFPLLDGANCRYNGPSNLIGGVLDGAAGSVAGIGTTKATRGAFETGLGSGVFAIGAPRSMEFGFKISF